MAHVPARVGAARAARTNRAEERTMVVCFSRNQKESTAGVSFTEGWRQSGLAFIFLEEMPFL